jgi:hypothetical protein
MFSDADAEEVDSDGLSAFHISVRVGALPVMKYFLSAYPPDDDDSLAIYNTTGNAALITLAVESAEPEAAWLILNHKSFWEQIDVNDAARWLDSPVSKPAFERRHGPAAQAKRQEMQSVLQNYFVDIDDSEPDSPLPSSSSDVQSADEPLTPESAFRPSHQTPNNTPSRGGYRGRGGYSPAASNNQRLPFNTSTRNRGAFGSRGHAYGRGRARGRGGARSW